MKMRLLPLTALVSPGPQFFEPMVEGSPLGTVLMDMFHADSADEEVPVTEQPLTEEDRQALELLLAPEQRLVVTTRARGAGSALTFYVTGDRVCRFDPLGDYLYALGGVERVRALARDLADELLEGQAEPKPSQPATLSAAGYFALLAWLAEYRAAWEPLDLGPADAVVTAEELAARLEGEQIVGVLRSAAMLAAPASVGEAFEQAAGEGVEELVEAGLLVETPGGYALTPAAGALIAPLALPLASMSLLGTALDSRLGRHDHFVAAADGKGLSQVSMLDGWRFRVASVAPPDLAAAIERALGESGAVASPLEPGAHEWPTPIWDQALLEAGLDVETDQQHESPPADEGPAGAAASAEPAGVGPARFCTGCGARVAVEAARFCAACGRPL